MYTPTNRTYADIMTKVSEATEEWVQKKLASADAKEETATVVTEEDKQEQMLRISARNTGQLCLIIRKNSTLMSWTT